MKNSKIILLPFISYFLGHITLPKFNVHFLFIEINWNLKTEFSIEFIVRKLENPEKNWIRVKSKEIR